MKHNTATASYTYRVHVEGALFFLPCQKLFVSLQPKQQHKNTHTMKTNRPTITVKPDQSKARQDGTAPVYIFVNWRGRAKQATGIYTKPSEWRERTLSIVSSPSSTRKLRQLVDEVEANITRLMEQGQPFTAKDVLNTTDNTRITPTQLAFCGRRKQSK